MAPAGSLAGWRPPAVRSAVPVAASPGSTHFDMADDPLLTSTAWPLIDCRDEFEDIPWNCFSPDSKDAPAGASPFTLHNLDIQEEDLEGIDVDNLCELLDREEAAPGTSGQTPADPVCEFFPALAASSASLDPSLSSSSSSSTFMHYDYVGYTDLIVDAPAPVECQYRYASSADSSSPTPSFSSSSSSSASSYTPAPSRSRKSTSSAPAVRRQRGGVAKTATTATHPQRLPFRPENFGVPPPGEDKDAYRERRDKNNASSARSRQKRVAALEALRDEAFHLEATNAKLEQRAADLTLQVERLKQAMLKVVAN